MKRLLAIGFIWFASAVAWMGLGTSLVVRSGASDHALSREVHALWGPPLVQQPPTASVRITETRSETVTEYDGAGRPHTRVVQREEERARPGALAGSDLKVHLDLEHRQKGLLWFATYGVDFEGRYVFENPGDVAGTLDVRFPLQADSLVYDGFQVTDARGEAVPATVEAGGAAWSVPVGPKERRRFRVTYRSRGTSSWSYGQAGRGLGGGSLRVRDFHLAMTTNFPEVDFPAGGLSPETHAATADGWRGEWSFDSLVSAANLGVVLPQRLEPGPLASRITFFAPVSLLFFFFVVAVLAEAGRRRLHPMNYFFFAAAFFAFHLLFAYLVDHVPVAPAFAVAAATSIFLVVTYARWFTGWRFALREMGLAQLIYLVLFSVTFFWKGFTGLAITLGAVVTLFVMMQVTGRLDWSRVGASVRPDPLSDD